MRSYLLMVLSSCLGVFVAMQTAAAAPVRNVVLIISDDLKASVLGCYGDRTCQTPNLDRLAREGVLFERAYCQGTSCAPSRNSLMFGRYRGRQGTDVGTYLRSQGIHTARVGKIYHMRVPGDIIAGTDGQDVATSWSERYNSQGEEAHTPGAYACLNLNIFTKQSENRQSTRMPHRMFVTVQSDGDGSDQPDYRSASKAMDLIDQHGHEGFFLAVGFVRPHYPMVQPPKYFELYPWKAIALPQAKRDDVEDIPRLGRAGTQSSTNPIGQYPDNQKRMWSGYYASVTFMDEQVGRILDHLDRRGLRESTAIIFTSDHGYHLGEHGFWQKSNLHEEVLRVPLIVSAPQVTPGRSPSIVELVDLYPTICDLFGHPAPRPLEGTSLLPALRHPEQPLKPGALSIHKQHYAWRVDQWHYLRYSDGTAELYDMRRDPQQIHNLAEEPRFASIRLELERQLQDKLATLKP